MLSCVKCLEKLVGKHAELQKKIIDFLNISGHYVWPNPTGAYRRGGVWIKYGKVGSGDIIGMLKNGIFISVECKKDNDSHREKQKEFASLTEQHNAVYIICRSFNEFKEKYAKNMKGVLNENYSTYRK